MSVQQKASNVILKQVKIFIEYLDTQSSQLSTEWFVDSGKH